MNPLMLLSLLSGSQGKEEEKPILGQESMQIGQQAQAAQFNMIDDMMKNGAPGSEVGKNNFAQMKPVGQTQTADFSTPIGGGSPMVLPDNSPMDWNQSQSDGGYVGQQGSQGGDPQQHLAQKQFNQNQQASGGGAGNMLNLTGTVKEPNAFLRMSQGYTGGGMLGALGMLLTDPKTMNPALQKKQQPQQ
tara:strand:- start:19333 stop:19899 length:567 start_codon:yes stop_codon:yes gene_type:complete